MRSTSRTRRRTGWRIIGPGLRAAVSLAAVVLVVGSMLTTSSEERQAQAETQQTANQQLQAGISHVIDDENQQEPLHFERFLRNRRNLEAVESREDPLANVGEPGSAGRAAEQLISTGVSPLASRVQALGWIEAQGGVVETDTETGGLIVRLDSNPELTDLTPLVALPEITGLYVSSQRELDLSPLVSLSELRALTLQNCPELRDVTSLAGLTQLRVLYLQFCPFLSNLEGLAGLENLEELYVSHAGIGDLSPLVRLGELRIISLYGCQHVRDVSPLAFLEKLEQASFISCMCLEDVSALENMPNLQVLNTRFQGC